MKSEVVALEGILDFLLRSKPTKKDKKPVTKAVKKEEVKEDKQPEEAAKGKTIMMSMGSLAAKHAPKKKEEPKKTKRKR